MELLAVLAVILLIVTPILAIAAFIRVQTLTEQLRIFPLTKIVDRLSDLERHFTAIEKGLSSSHPAGEPPRPEAPPAAPPMPPPQTAGPPHLQTAPSAPIRLPEIPKPRELSQPLNVFAAPPFTLPNPSHPPCWTGKPLLAADG